MRKHQTLIQSYSNGTYDRIVAGPSEEELTGYNRYHPIEGDGLCAPGQVLRHGDILVNKQSPQNSADSSFSGPPSAVQYRNAPITYKYPAEGYVDKVLLSHNEREDLLVKVLIRQTRRPELGDKFSSRHGQKGVCGLIVNQEDMPFNDEGICPGKSSP